MNIVKIEVAYVLTTLSAKLNKKVANKILKVKKQAYEKTNYGLMKILCSTLIDYENTKGGPMERP